jgi:hypothetical protein
VPSLLALQLRFDQLLIDDAQLVVRRDPRATSASGSEMAGQLVATARATLPPTGSSSSTSS